MKGLGGVLTIAGRRAFIGTAASACHDTVQSMRGLGGVLTIADGRSSIGTAAGGENARAPGLLSLSIAILIILYKHQLFTPSSSSFC